jgi:hypothetical protein
MQYAKLDPFQQANYAIGRGAYQLAGALGGEDPQLKLVSARNSIAKQIDYSDLNSIAQGVRMLGNAGDTVGAMQLADIYRKAQSESALTQQRQKEALTSEQRNADAYAKQFGSTGSQEYQTAFKQRFDQLSLKGEIKEPASTSEMKNAAAKANLTNYPPNSDEWNAVFSKELARLTAKPEIKEPRFGDAAERYAKSMFKGKTYNELTDAEAAIVNKRVDEEAAAKATKVSVNLSDPTATAKASLDVMNKWEGFLKSGGDVEVANRYKTVKSAVEMANAGNPTADGSLLYNIAKMYDPGGAVQEGDKKSITGNPAIPDKFKLLVQGVLEGGSFTPQQRKNLETIANDIVKNRQGQLQRYQKQYIKKNTALGGDAEDIFNPYEGLLIPKLPSGAGLIPSDSTGTKSNVGQAIPATPMEPAKQVKKPSVTPGAVSWKDL